VGDQDPLKPGLRSVHKAVRWRYAALVEAGLAVCARCGKPIVRGAPSTSTTTTGARATSGSVIEGGTAGTAQQSRTPSSLAAIYADDGTQRGPATDSTGRGSGRGTSRRTSRSTPRSCASTSRRKRGPVNGSENRTTSFLPPDLDVPATLSAAEWLGLARIGSSLPCFSELGPMRKANDARRKSCGGESASAGSCMWSF
jgi:hypothetical protein